MLLSQAGIFNQDLGDQGLWDISTAVFNQTFSDLVAPETDPTGVAFKPDGTKMFVVGIKGDTISSYHLSIPWDISTALEEHVFVVASQESVPRSLKFKPDGTRMFAAGNSGNDVNEYALTSAWDISSATHVQNQSFMTALSYIHGFFFRPDGTRLFVIQYGTQHVLSYNLSTAWDTTTLSFHESIYIGSQEYSPWALYFKPDGTKMFVIGRSGIDVNEYSLSSAWELSSANFDHSFSVQGQESNPSGLQFDTSGVKMYVSGYSSDSVHEYDLSSPWDVSSASFNHSFSVSAQTSYPYGLLFKPDGSRLYILSNNRDIHEFSMSTAWDISTATFLLTVSTTSYTSSSYGMFFKDDGYELFVMQDFRSARIASCSLSSPWDLSTLSFVQSSVPVIGYAYYLFANCFSSNGDKMYLSTFYGEAVIEYNLTTPWDFTTAQFSTILDLSSISLNYVQDITFNSSGTKFYVVDYSYNRINQFDLSSAWNLGSATFSQYKSVSGSSQSMAMALSTDESKMYVVSAFNDSVDEYDITNGDISTAVFFQRKSEILAADPYPTGLFFRPDGLKLYVIGYSTRYLIEYSMSSAWDINSSTYVRSLYVGSQESSPCGVFFKNDGTKLYIIGRSGDEVNEYNLSIAWDISSASFFQYFKVNVQETSPTSLFFRSDGIKMYIVGYSGDKVHEFDLSVAWDVSSANVAQSFLVSSQESTPRGLFFKSDGTKMYVMGSSGDDVNEYNLATPWDISNATYVQNFYVGNKENNPSGLWIKPDGSRMFVVGYGNDAIHEYVLG
ncbi:MAG: hypothetical protein ABJN36_12405 [Cyclobacteriaceae bacterium]